MATLATESTSEQRESERRGSSADREHEERQRSHAREGEREPDRRGERREHDDGVEDDVDTGGKTRQMTRDGAVGGEDDEQTGERRAPAG